MALQAAISKLCGFEIQNFGPQCGTKRLSLLCRHNRHWLFFVSKTYRALRQRQGVLAADIV
jgi:hypothetical protein